MKIIVAGTGKMARDIGIFLIARGLSVTFVSRDTGRLDQLERWAKKKIKRLEVLAPDLYDESVTFGEVSFCLVGDDQIGQADLCIECINEDETDKQALILALSQALGQDVLFLSNSSSIFPFDLHPECIGVHFFYPVELTGFVEVVLPKRACEEKKRDLFSLLSRLGLSPIVQGEAQAFAINRLFLPLQNEAIRLVMAGIDPKIVDQASLSSILPVGQLTLMDTIGFDVVYPAVCNYLSRMEKRIVRHYLPLRDGLNQLLIIGKKGKKNKDGFFRGQALPWSFTGLDSNDPEVLSERFRCLFVNICFHVLERNLLGEEELNCALNGLFGWQGDLEAALEPLTVDQAFDHLNRAFKTTSRPYFLPAKFFRQSSGQPGDWPDFGLVI